MARAWVYLALRDERLIGAGARLEDARRLCETKMAQMHEEEAYGGWQVRDLSVQPSHGATGTLAATHGVYAIRRVPVARFDGEGGE